MIKEMVLALTTLGGSMADQAFFDRLALYEGFSHTAYNDHLGYVTVGYGTRLDDGDERFVARMGHTVEGLMSGRESLCRYDAMRLMRWKFGRIVGALDADDALLYRRLKPGVRAVVDDLLFNMGPGVLKKFSRFRDCLEKHAYSGEPQLLAQAANELLYHDGSRPERGRSQYARQVGRRAQDNANKLLAMAGDRI